MIIIIINNGDFYSAVTTDSIIDNIDNNNADLYSALITFSKSALQ